MSIESEIRELEIEQRKYSMYSIEWKRIEDKINELKRKRKRREEDDDDDIIGLASLGILSGLGDSDYHSGSDIDFGGGDSGGGGFGGDF